jgi:hypothetical protein
MTERFKVLVLKTSVVQATVGSNPTLSARRKKSISKDVGFFLLEENGI